MTSAAFAVHYQQHVWPLLYEKARLNATLVACGLLSFAAASDEIMRLAIARGASFLPDLDALHGDIMSMLSAEIERGQAKKQDAETLLANSPSAFWREVWGFK